MLSEQIRKDMTEAMKAKEKQKVTTLRAVLAAIKEAEVAGATPTQLDDAGVTQVIAAAVKKRIEAAEIYEEASATEKAELERAEQQILEAYLPKKLDDSELAEIVSQTLTQHGFSDAKDMGLAMKAVNQEVAGRADGRKVADAVKAALVS